MSFCAGLLPSLVRSTLPARRCASSPSRLFHYLPSGSPQSMRPSIARSPNAVSRVVAHARPYGKENPRMSSAYLYSIGLGLAAFSLFPRAAQCASTPSPTLPLNSPSAANRVSQAGTHVEPPVESEFNISQLTFGAVCGICAGVFVKKGLRALAFALGGVFVLLQYLSSKSYVTVDWARFSNRYDSAIGTKTPTGEIRYPTIRGVYAGIVDFLTANFQQRATFIAGFILGIRLG